MKNIMIWIMLLLSITYTDRPLWKTFVVAFIIYLLLSYILNIYFLPEKSSFILSVSSKIILQRKIV